MQINFEQLEAWAYAHNDLGAHAPEFLKIIVKILFLTIDALPEF